MQTAAERRLAARARRVLTALVPKGRRLSARDDGSYALFSGTDRAPKLVVDPALAEALIRRDWLRADGRADLVPTEAGRAFLRRAAAPDDPWRGQHLVVEETVQIDADGRRHRRSQVVNESPLAWLRRRRGPGGKPLLSDAQFRAGERLRAEFERGQLNPRVTADWSGQPGGKGRRGPESGAVELLQSALAARGRVDKALQTTGPELGSLLVDVCCFLIGLEDAEARRGWPRRSAKVVLVIGLDRLAEHYGYADTAIGAPHGGGIVHWGDGSFRPALNGD